jgi:hypothetical protein
MLNALDTLVDNGLSDDALDAVLEDLLEGDSFDDDADKRVCIALAWSREQGNKDGPGDCEYLRDDNVRIGGAEYLVLDDDEADARWDEYLESMLDEDGMIEGASGPYFDREAWKRDAKMDGRGHCLAGYDGAEQEFRIDRDGKSEYWYLYRTN